MADTSTLKKKAILVAELFAVSAVGGALIAAAGVDPTAPGVTTREVIASIGAGAIGATYAVARLIAPVLIGTLSDFKDAIVKQLFDNGQ